MKKRSSINAPIVIPPPDDTLAVEALAAWLQATPEQRLELLKEMWRLSRLLTGKVSPWDLPEYK